MEGKQERITGSAGGSLWRQSLEEQKQSESRLDGVLLFLAFTLVASLLVNGYTLYFDIQVLAQPPVFHALFDQDAYPWLRNVAESSAGGILGSVWTVCLLCVLLWLFVRRKRQFRTAMIWSLIVSVTFPLLLGLMADKFTFGPTTQALIPAIVTGAFGAIVWLPYLLYSQRVKNVFVR